MVLLSKLCSESLAMSSYDEISGQGLEMQPYPCSLLEGSTFGAHFWVPKSDPLIKIMLEGAQNWNLNWSPILGVNFMVGMPVAVKPRGQSLMLAAGAWFPQVV